MKNLENEYKRITEENVPDLWSRIEAGIDKLEEEKETAAVEVISSNKTERVVSFEKSKAIKRIVPILVAAAAFVLAFGLYAMTGNSRKNATSDMAADFAYDSAAEAGVAAPEAEMAEAAAEANVADAEMVEEAAEANAEVAEEAAEANAEDSAPAADSYEKDNSEIFVNSKSEDKTAGISDKHMEYCGRVTVCEDPAFIEIVTDDGNTLKMYVPSEYREVIEEAAKDDKQLEIVYEEIDSELAGKFPDEYSDTQYQIYKIK